MNSDKMMASPSQTIDELLTGFGLRDTIVEPVTDSFHTNLRVRRGADTFFLKVVNEENNQRQVRFQMEFMEHLRRDGLPVVETVPTSDGKPCAISADGRSIGILSRWIDGQNVSERPEEDWPARCGELLARVHQQASVFQPSTGFSARAWDEIYAPEPGGWLDQFLGQTSFDGASRCVILESASCIRSMVQRLPKCDETYGVIHADFHLDNLMFDGTKVWIIDFDDIGWGHYLFDLAWPEALFAKHNGSSRFFKFFRTGYERVRPLLEIEHEALPGFRLAAGISVIEMVDASPIPNRSPKAREWFSFAVDWLRRTLLTSMGRSVWAQGRLHDE